MTSIGAQGLDDLLQHPDQVRLLDGVLRHDRLPDVADTWAMRLMRSPLIVGIYESYWRPALMRLVSSLGNEGEDAVIERYLRPRPGLQLLELCCGTARVGRSWAERGSRVLAIDMSLPMLIEARRRCSHETLVLVQGDVRHPIARPASSDAVFCFAALHLFDDLASVVGPAGAALRPGGRFFAWIVTTRGIMSGVVFSGIARRAGLTLRPPGTLARATREQGLEVVAELSYGAVDFVVAQRPES